jgi:hypothetical protein
MLRVDDAVRDERRTDTAADRTAHGAWPSILALDCPRVAFRDYRYFTR